MPETNTPREAVVLVEPISTPRAMIGLVASKNILPIVIFTNYRVHPENAVYELLHLRDETEKSIRKEYKKQAFFINEPNDYNALIKQLKQYQIIGVIKGSDGGVRLGEKISRSFNLPTNRPNFFNWALDKFKVNKKIKSAGVRAIKTFLFNRKDNHEKLILKCANHYPLFIKPPLGAGGCNSYIAYNAKDLKKHIKEIFNIRNNQQYLYREILVQELINGEEYVVNTYTQNGHHYVSDVWKYIKEITNRGAFIYRNTILLNGNSVIKQTIINYATSVLNACKFQNGPCHMEIKVDHNGPVLIECNWRTMGGSQFLTEPLCLGSSQNGLYLSTATEPHFGQEKLNKLYEDYSGYAECLDIMPQIHGTVKRINLPFLLQKLPSFHRDIIFVDPGFKVIPAQSIDDDLGNIQFYHHDHSILKKDVDLFMEIEDHCLDIFFEFEQKPIDRDYKLPRTTNSDLKKLEAFITEQKGQLIGLNRSAKILWHNLTKNKTHVNKLHTNKHTYVIIDNYRVSSDICKSFTWIDQLERKIKKGTTLVFTNNFLNKTCHGFKYLLALNNLLPRTPANCQLLHKFSFWTKK